MNKLDAYGVQAPAPLLCGPEAVTECVRRLTERPAAIERLADALQEDRVDIRRQNTDVPGGIARQQLTEQDRQRIGFLARGAAGAPEPQRAQRGPAVEQLGHDLLPQRVELGVVAEEVGFADREVCDDRVPAGAASDRVGIQRGEVLVRGRAQGGIQAMCQVGTLAFRII